MKNVGKTKKRRKRRIFIFKRTYSHFTPKSPRKLRLITMTLLNTLCEQCENSSLSVSQIPPLSPVSIVSYALPSPRFSTVSFSSKVHEISTKFPIIGNTTKPNEEESLKNPRFVELVFEFVNELLFYEGKEKSKSADLEQKGLAAINNLLEYATMEDELLKKVPAGVTITEKSIDIGFYQFSEKIRTTYVFHDRKNNDNFFGYKT